MIGEALLAAVLPGWGVRRRSLALAIGLALLGCGVPLATAAYALWQRRPWVALWLDGDFLRLVVVAGAAAIAARIAAVAEVWVAHARPLGWRAMAAAGVLAATIAPLGWATLAAGQARPDLNSVFSADLDSPLWDASTESGHSSIIVPDRSPANIATAVDPAPDATSPFGRSRPYKVANPGGDPLSGCPSSGVDPAAHANVTTILLLGGDAGPGRWSLRTDTIMLFSIHGPSGRAALTSVPRNLMRLRFPPGSALGGRYPYGFSDLASAVYPVVQSHADLRTAYGGLAGVDPGVVALAEGLGCSLDVTIDDYVLIDMRGFVALIDAIGGVTVDVPRAVPMPGNIPGGATDYPDTLGPGTIHMSGTLALGYVRSRTGDSDYARTDRQRQLLAALAKQVSAGDVLAAYGRVTAALGATLRTSLSPDELAHTLAVIGGETAIVESVGLVPPLVDVNQPDWQRLASIVADVQVALETGRPSAW